MLTLYLVRHAKASEGAGTAKDHERPLADVGVQAARAVGAELQARGCDLGTAIWCSTARRALQTFEEVAHAFPGLQATLDQRIYEADARTLLALIKNAADTESTVTVFGHNPTLHELARALAGTGEPSLRMALSSHFPPGAVVRIEFDVDRWSDVAAGGGTLTLFVTPQDAQIRARR